MNYRTDLALERREIANLGEEDGVTVKKYGRKNARITQIEIVSEDGARKIGKPVGKYITVELPSFSADSEIFDGRLGAVSDSVGALLPSGCGLVLVAGLGNPDITPDALGPLAAKGIFATRHIGERLAKELGFAHLRPVSAITFGVLGQTGIETAETLHGIVRTISPSAVITVDALASGSLARLGNTVQLTDTGITPGSGVGNSRAEINEKTLGVPVIAVGVPTVVDAATLVGELTREDGIPEELREQARAMMVTPREIDAVVERAAKLISLALNCALQPDVPPRVLYDLV